MSRMLWGALVVLVIAGLYFLLWHADPFPGNHEAIGLGMDHLVHSVFVIVILIGAIMVFMRIRRGVPAASATE